MVKAEEAESETTTRATKLGKAYMLMTPERKCCIIDKKRGRLPGLDIGEVLSLLDGLREKPLRPAKRKRILKAD